MRLYGYIVVVTVLLFTVSGVDAKTVITFWHAMGDPKDKTLNSLIDEFEKLNPDIKINAEFIGNYDVLLQKLLASLVAKNPPDMAQVYENWTTRFKEAGCLVPIEKFIKDDFRFRDELNDFYPVFIKNNSYNNEIWTFPFNKSIYVLYYNSYIFEKEGIKNPPENIEEFLKICKKLKKKDEKRKIIRYGFGFRLNVDIFSIIFYLNGGRFFNENETKAIFNNKTGVDSLKFIVDLVKNEYAYYTKDYLDNDFASRRFAMFFATSPHYAYLKNLVSFPVGVDSLPEGKIKAAPIAGTNLAIFKSRGGLEKQLKCFRFIKWLSQAPQVAKWSIGTSYLPIRRKALKEKNMKLHLTNNKTELVGIMELDYAVTDPRIKVWNEARIFIGEAVEKSLIGKLTPKEALDEAVYKINILLYSN